MHRVKTSGMTGMARTSVARSYLTNQGSSLREHKSGLLSISQLMRIASNTHNAPYRVNISVMRLMSVSIISYLSCPREVSSTSRSICIGGWFVRSGHSIKEKNIARATTIANGGLRVVKSTPPSQNTDKVMTNTKNGLMYFIPSIPILIMTKLVARLSRRIT